MISILIEITTLINSIGRPPSSTSSIELFTESGIALLTESGASLIAE